MSKFKIAVIAGDGVGQEVIPHGKSILNRLGEFSYTDFDWGSDYYFLNGRMCPPDFLDRLSEHDAIFLGAVGHPSLPDHITLNGLLLPIRRRFDQYANVRPAILFRVFARLLRCARAR